MANMLDQQSWYLYIAQSKSGKYYVGISTNITRRITTHNQKQGSHLAKFDGPFTLRYSSPSLNDQSHATRIEIQVKKWRREKKERLISGKLDLLTIFPPE